MTTRNAGDQNESRHAFESRIKSELQELLSKKMEKLLKRQTEATKVTADAAKQFARLQEVRNKELHEHINKSPTKEHTRKGQEPSTGSRSQGKRVAPVPSKELRSLISSTESRIPDIISAIEKTESSGNTIPRTLTEVIDKLDGNSKRGQNSSQSITEDIAEELNTAGDISEKLEDDDDDEDTLKDNTKKSETIRDEESSSCHSDTASSLDPKILSPSASTLSLFSDGESLNRFTAQIFRRCLDECPSAKKQYELLKKKEASLIKKARLELSSLEGGETTKAGRTSMRKKERAILLDLKSKRAEIDRLKHGIRHKVKKRILKQQTKALGKHTSSTAREEDAQSSDAKTSGGSSEIDDSVSESVKSEKDKRANDVKSAERQILKGLQRLERNKKFLSEQESALLEKTKKFGKMLQSEELPSSEEEEEEIKTESGERPFYGGASTTSPSKIQSLKKSMGTTLKSPLSPKMAPTSARRRHSSADSDDSQSVPSQAETISDHSDVEIRISVLQDELKRRMITAAKLKRQQRSKSKEKLRMKEEALKKQIEQYDKLIEETKADLEESIKTVVQPQIKTPYKSADKSPSPPTPTTPRSLKPPFTQTLDEIEISSLGSQPIGDPEDNVSVHTLSHESSVDTIISNKEPLTPEEDRSEEVVTASAKDNKEDEEQQSDLNYSDDFTSSNASSEHTTTNVPASPTKPKSSPHAFPLNKSSKNEASNWAPTSKPPPSDDTSTKATSVPHATESRFVPSKANVKPSREVVANEITSGIVEDLILDACVEYRKASSSTASSVSNLRKGESSITTSSQPTPPKGKSKQRDEAISLGATTPITTTTVESERKPPHPIPSFPGAPTSPPRSSPRQSRPQDLMLSTFDISSESSDEGTLSVCLSVAKR